MYPGSTPGAGTNLRETMVIWKSIRGLHKKKMWCIEKIKGKQKLGRRITLDLNDVPVGDINEITGQFEPCDNHRGRAYGARNRLMYRKNKKKDK